MKRINLPIISDTFFCAACAFLLFYTAVRHYTKSITLSVVSGVAAAALFGTLAFIYIRRKQGKKLLSVRDEKQKNLLALHLSVCPYGQVQLLFCKLFDAAMQGDNLVTEDKIYFLKFCLSPLSQDDIAGVIKNSSPFKKVVLCNKISEDARQLADNFLIEIMPLDNLYPLIKRADLLPEKYLFEGTRKPKFFKRVKASFNKSRSRPLFVCGLCLLLFSYFTFFPAYYIAFGGGMIMLSLLCRLFGSRP